MTQRDPNGGLAREREASERAATDLEEEELLAKAQLERSVFRRLVPLLAPVRSLVSGVVVLEVVLVVLIFARPRIIQLVVDRGLADFEKGRIDVPLVAGAATALAVVWVGRFGGAAFSQFLAGRAAVSVLNGLRKRVHAHLQTLSIRYFDRTKSGRIVSRADRDIDALEPLLIQGPPELLSALLRCGGAGITLWMTSPALFWAVAVVVPVLVPALVVFHRLAAKNWGRVAERRSRFTAHLVDAVHGVRVIQQTGSVERSRARYKTLLDDFTGALLRGNVRTSWFLPLTAVLSASAMGLVLVAGGRGVADGQLTFGQVAASLFYVQLFLGPLQELGDLFERYAAGIAVAQRVFLLLDTRPEIVDPPVARELADVAGAVAFDGVSFAYEPRRGLAIDNLTLAIAPGERVAIVGPTGHGKSTLVQLLSRFYEPQRGAVRLDGADLRELSQRSLRANVGVVLQDNVLFDGTVIDNLRIGARDATEAQIAAAAQAMGVDEIFQRLPQGYATRVGAFGSQLSHGQRQLVSLLRTYLADPAVLVLDEATSAVDVRTERRIQHALGKLCAGRTAIIIAHRLATIRDADRIAVLRSGKLVEIGSHAELLARSGQYAAVHDAYEHSRAV